MLTIVITMAKKSVFQIRVEEERLEFWKLKAEQENCSVAQLIHRAMRIHLGLSPYEIEQMKLKTGKNEGK